MVSIASSNIGLMLMIVSNIGLALMMIIVYARYSKFRLSSGSEIKELRKNLEKEISEKKSFQEKLLVETKTEGEKVEALLREIDELRKEKEKEVKLRLEAEKQIELALQRTEEIQKRMHDWSVIQDAVMKDSKEAIIKVGNELFKKLNDSYKVEVETSKNLLGRFSKNISESFEKSMAGVVSVVAKQSTSATKKDSASSNSTVSSSKLIGSLVATMQKNNWAVNKEYFLPINFDENKSKLFFCEVAFVSLDKLYIVDIKASNYLEEYKHSRDEKVLKQKLDRYCDYLANPKYIDSILKVLASTEVKFDNSGIVVALASKEELQILKDINYYDKLRKIASEILDFDAVNNLVL